MHANVTCKVETHRTSFFPIDVGKKECINASHVHNDDFCDPADSYFRRTTFRLLIVEDACYDLQDFEGCAKV